MKERKKGKNHQSINQSINQRAVKGTIHTPYFVAAHICILILIILLLIIIIIIPVITFTQGIYNYIPETNHVSRVQSVAAVL
jgi:hypothetical protein